MTRRILYVAFALALTAACWWGYSNRADRYHYSTITSDNYPLRIEKTTGQVEIFDLVQNVWVRIEEPTEVPPAPIVIPEEIVMEVLAKVRATPTPERIYRLDELEKLAKEADK